MHLGLILAGVLQGTLILVLSFFVLFAAQRAQGSTALLGRIVGVWLLALAVVCLAGAATAPMFGGRPFGLSSGLYPICNHYRFGAVGERNAAPSPTIQLEPAEAPNTNSEK